MFTDEGKPLRTWLELLRSAMGGEIPKGGIHYSSFGSSVLSPGEQAHVFSFTCGKGAAKKPAPADEPADEPPPQQLELLPRDEVCRRLVTALRHLSLSICYCSTLGDCWTLVDEPGHDAFTTETRRCPARSERSFN
jgi:hypothetical protein